MAPSGVFPWAAHRGSRATVPLISSQDSIRQEALSELWPSYAESTFAFAHSATFFEHGTAISHASLDEPTLAAAPYCATSSARLGWMKRHTRASMWCCREVPKPAAPLPSVIALRPTVFEAPRAIYLIQRHTKKKTKQEQVHKSNDMNARAFFLLGLSLPQLTSYFSFTLFESAQSLAKSPRF